MPFLSRFRLNFFIQNRIISVLLIVSFLLIGAHSLGLFEKQFSLLDSANHELVETFSSGSANASFEYKDKLLFVSECEMLASKENDICGINILFSRAVDKGIDLRDYSRLEIQLEMKTPLNKPHIKLSFRNFNSVYADTSNETSLKYNSLIISPKIDDAGNALVDSIPLAYLYVDSWWVKQFKIDSQNAQVDVSNVSNIEVVLQDSPNSGHYQFTIKRLTLKGDRLSLTQMLVLNSIIWVLVIYLLIQRQAKTLRDLSSLDALTGLPNRRGMQNWLDKLKITPQKPQHLSLFFIDIDDFKITNDTFGHKVGDQLLIDFSQRISTLLKAHNNKQQPSLFCRLSGDEFVVLLQDRSQQDCCELATKILTLLETPLVIDKNNINVQVSLGSSSDIIYSSDIGQLTANADAAMYLAKRSGKNQYRAFSKVKDSGVIQQKTLAKTISDAMAHNQFDLKFMPIFDVKTKLVKNVEVLIRSDTPELAKFSTKTIVQIAEDFNLIQELDEWVLNNTLSLLSENRDLVARLGLTFCVNVSTLDLQNRSFFQRTKQMLEKYEIPAAWIELEITENALTKSSEVCTNCLTDLKNLGIKLALDEFGTGYTAFNQLINYPVNKIKINSAYVSAIGHDDVKIKVLTDAIINIANSFELQVTAVGVETLEQYYYFANKGCQYVQGYLLSEPLTFRELARGLRNQDAFEMKQKLGSQNKPNDAKYRS